MKTEIEDGPANFQILFLNTEKVSEFLILSRSYSIQWQLSGKKWISKKLCLPLKRGILPLVLVLYALLTLGSILNRYSGD